MAGHKESRIKQRFQTARFVKVAEGMEHQYYIAVRLARQAQAAVLGFDTTRGAKNFLRRHPLTGWVIDGQAVKINKKLRPVARRDGCETCLRQSAPSPIRGRVRARHKIAFAQDHGERAEFTLVELKRGAGGETSLIQLTPGEALNSAMENVVSPDFDPMGVVRLIKRQAEAERLFCLTVAPGGTERALDLLLNL